jgi:TnpA family transposase
MRVERNYVDSHGQSEVAFAFCRLLSLELMPRLKRIKHERLYLPEPGMKECLPQLTGVLERPIRWELIAEQYDEIVRHVVAVSEGTGPVESILRRFNSYNRAHPTYRACIELGKALKTIFLCRYLSEPALRQEIHAGLNVVENWNGIVEFIFYGRKTELQTNDPELQELAVLCLQLLQNTVILANTIMVERVLEEDGLLAHLSPGDRITPLFTRHINPYGDFDLDFAKPSFLAAELEKVA